MEPVRSVLYLDFDNVFGALAKLDPKIAMSFAEQPRAWLRRLAGGGQDESPRRWLVLRCYMNPAGWIPHPENSGARLYFSKFRPPFTDAGFEVVDCPRLSHTKNGADIRLVIDAVEALRADVRYEEFVIASGDSDMTPLIVRLRASDRRTTLLSPSDSAVVLGAVADRLIGGEELLELLEAQAEELEDDLEDSAGVNLEAGFDAPRPNLGLTEAEAKVMFGELVAQRYAQASEPMNLATLADELRGELGPVTSTSRWFGYNGFTRALQALDLPGVKMSQHFIWDSRRHAAPTPAGADNGGPQLPDPVRRVTAVLKLPTLPSESWSNIYDSLAGFVAAYEFNLTEATRWSRDRLAERGIRVNRQAVGIVAHGVAYGGCPLYRQPPPRAEDLATAFVANVLNRAAATDIDLSSEEVEEVRNWFGVP
ncbi:MAG TPA: NYN domain-containing protein [Nocardioidaceae bacterium]